MKTCSSWSPPGVGALRAPCAGCPHGAHGGTSSPALSNLSPAPALLPGLSPPRRAHSLTSSIPQLLPDLKPGPSPAAAAHAAPPNRPPSPPKPPPCHTFFHLFFLLFRYLALRCHSSKALIIPQPAPSPCPCHLSLPCRSLSTKAIPRGARHKGYFPTD